MILHLPARPDWLCRACQNPWPCRAAEAILAAQYRGAPNSRHTYLTDMAAVAAFDLCTRLDRGAPVVDRIIAARDAA